MTHSGTLVAKYPRLSALTQQQGGRSLDDLAASPDPVVDYLSLATSAAWVAREFPRAEQVADPYGYLATIEEFLSSFDETAAPPKALWKKLKASAGSEFLDTISELSLALDFRKRGMAMELDKNFAGRESGDADIVLHYGGVELWLDVISIEPNEPPADATQSAEERSQALEDGTYEPSSAFLPGQTEQEISDHLSRKVRNKYKSKFEKALVKGQLAGKTLGVLACILKAQEDVVALFLPFVNVKLRLRPDLWTQFPALGAVGVFDLRKGPGEVLVPLPLLDTLVGLRPAI
jgi:hypothetical protein